VQDLQGFLAAGSFAVAGASHNPDKYGHMVFQALLRSGRDVYPVNPTADQIAGRPAYPRVGDIPVAVAALSIVTPPEVTRAVVVDAIAAGVQHIWMQPGAEDASASKAAREAGLNVIDDGSCILVLLSREK
jgi:predicted CoA-binding protein